MLSTAAVVLGSLFITFAIWAIYGPGDQKPVTDPPVASVTEEPAEIPPTAPATLPEGSAEQRVGPVQNGCTTEAGSRVGGDLPGFATQVGGVRPHRYVWSPDCAWIALSVGSSTYIMRADGSDLRPVGSDSDYSRDPVWSPDSSILAYVSRSEIYTVTIAGGSNVKLTSSNEDPLYRGEFWYRSFDPAWSPDGDRIVFTSNRDGDDEIYSMRADGGRLVQLTANSEGGRSVEPDWSPDGTRSLISDRSPAWSPDGTRIAFTSNRDGNDEIYVMDTDGSRVTRLTDNDASDRDPVWSPDGARIAFSSNRDGDREIYTVAAEGGHLRRITDNKALDRAPAWSPDGALIFYHSHADGEVRFVAASADGMSLTGDHTTRFPPVEPPSAVDCDDLDRSFRQDAGAGGPVAPTGLRPVYRFGWSPDCRLVLRIGDRADGYGIVTTALDGLLIQWLTDDGYWYSNPVWSPDGSRIAFESDRDGSYEVYVMDGDGTNVSRLTNLNARQSSPAWASDGSMIAFVRGKEIWTIRADGTGLGKLTNNIYNDGTPTWSPDGTTIAFTSNRDGDNEIYTMNPDGTNTRQLTHNTTDDRNPVWSPDGTTIAFTGNRDGDNEVYTMNPDGTGIHQVTHNTTDDSNPVWSPDSTSISVTNGEMDEPAYYIYRVRSKSNSTSGDR